MATLNVSGSAGQNNGNADWLGNADYTFLMSCDLIESCRSLNGEMSWDNGDLDMEHLRMADRSALSTGTNNQSVAVGCQTDAEVTIPGIKNFEFRYCRRLFSLPPCVERLSIGETEKKNLMLVS